MIAITHTPTDGTVLKGSSRGDGTNHLLKPLTWRWSAGVLLLVSGVRGVGERFDAEPVGSFVLGEAAPDAVGFTDAQCMLKTLGHRLAPPAYLFGCHDPVLAVAVPFVGGMKKY